MKTQYVVSFSKFIVKGPLKGMMVDAKVSWATLEGATEFVAHCHRHLKKPVKAIGGGDYTCHMATIQTI